MKTIHCEVCSDTAVELLSQNLCRQNKTICTACYHYSRTIIYSIKLVVLINTESTTINQSRWTYCIKRTHISCNKNMRKLTLLYLFIFVVANNFTKMRICVYLSMIKIKTQVSSCVSPAGRGGREGGDKGRKGGVLSDQEKWKWNESLRYLKRKFGFPELQADRTTEKGRCSNMLVSWRTFLNLTVDHLYFVSLLFLQLLLYFHFAFSQSIVFVSSCQSSVHLCFPPSLTLKL